MIEAGISCYLWHLRWLVDGWTCDFELPCPGSSSCPTVTISSRIPWAKTTASRFQINTICVFIQLKPCHVSYHLVPFTTICRHSEFVLAWGKTKRSRQKSFRETLLCYVMWMWCDWCFVRVSVNEFVGVRNTNIRIVVNSVLSYVSALVHTLSNLNSCHLRLLPPTNSGCLNSSPFLSCKATPTLIANFTSRRTLYQTRIGLINASTAFINARTNVPPAIFRIDL